MDVMDAGEREGLKSREKNNCDPGEVAESKVKIRKTRFIAVVCIDLLSY